MNYQNPTITQLTDDHFAEREVGSVSESEWRAKYDDLAAGSNPVVRTTQLRAYPGWRVREYQDGTFDAESRTALSWGCESFVHAVAAARYLATGEQGDILQVPGFAR